MLHLQRTTVGDLKPGDRFYKQGDKKQLKYEIILHPVKRTRFYTYRYFARLADALRSPIYALRHNTKVIFLAHVDRSLIK